MSEINFLCEKCGSNLEQYKKGSTGGVICSKCNWGVVTTEMPEINLDFNIYEVFIRNGDCNNKSHIQTVSSIKGINFLKARNIILDEKLPLVFKGEAKEVVGVREKIKLAGMECVIKPGFPW